MEGKNKLRLVVLFMSLHAMLTALLLVGMAHMLTRMTQQERENANLREILFKHVHMASKHKTENSEIETERRGFQNEMLVKSKEKNETEEHVENDDEEVGVQPMILRNKRRTSPKCCEKGSRGRKGKKGNKGERGKQGIRGYMGISITGMKGQAGQSGRQGLSLRGSRGDKGEKGDMGVTGANGQTGIPGQQGLQGNKGTKGDCGGHKTMYSELLHVVGVGKKIRLAGAKPITSWKLAHKNGKIHYSNGSITIGVNGFYYIYSQMYYYDKTAIMGHVMKIGDRQVLKSVYSVPNANPYKTQYIGGVFNISKGQNISISVPFSTPKVYYFDAGYSYFGAFMVHSLE